MSEWKKVKLGELCDFINGGAWSDKEYVSDGIPVLKVTNCKNSGFSISELSYLPYSLKQKYSQNELRLHDVIIATVGSHPNLVNSSAGRSVIVNSFVTGFYLNQNAVCIRTKKANILNQLYFGYYSKYYLFQNYIQMRGKGAANQMRIAISSIKDYPMPLPPIEHQAYIATILSRYDSLIENYQKQIKLLEEAAQRLYKEWFVDLHFPGHETTKIIDGVPEGWEKKKVGDMISKIQRTKQVTTNNYQASGKIPVIDQSRNYIAGYTDDAECLVKVTVPYIVFGDHTRILKYIPFSFAKGADGTQLIMSNDLERMPQTLFYNSLIEIDLSNYSYARHFKYLKEEFVLLPSEYIARKYDSIVSRYYQSIQKSREQIRLLTEARDRLLPKLMNGELNVYL